MRRFKFPLTIDPFVYRMAPRAAVSISSGTSSRPPLSLRELTRLARSSRIVQWLIANAMPIATYQLALEAICTGAIGWMLLHGHAVPEDIAAWLHAWHYPFTGLMDWESGRHEKGFTFAGQHVDAATLTALHTGHNVANGLLPLQVLVLAATYPMVARLAGAAWGPLSAHWTRAMAMVGYAKPARASAQAQTVHPFGKSQRRRYR